MPEQFMILLFAALGLLALAAISLKSGQGSLDGIKAKPVGDGQHGTARWATPKEIAKTFSRVPFKPSEWRQGKNLPKAQGLVLGSQGEKGKVVALVDSDDVHCLMIGASGVGKTAFFLYPNLEYACACGMSFLALDTKGDLARNYGAIAQKYYGYQVSVIDLRNPTRSDGFNFLTLVNHYMDESAKHPDDLAVRARAEKYAKILSKTIINPDGDSGNRGQNAYFYESAEGLLTSAIILLAEFLPPREIDGELRERRHIVSVFKLVQDLLEPSGVKGKSRFQVLMSRLPDEHKAKWFAGAALNTSEQAMASVLSTVLSRLNAFLDTELEQTICFDSPLDAETFASRKSAIFLILPEEDQTKNFMAGLMIQNLSRELFSVADENGGKLKNRVVLFCDELGTMPPFDILPLFSAGRSRRLTLVPIIQSLAQLEKNYGKEGSEIIQDNVQDTIFGGFAPNSKTAEVLSKSLGSYTVQSGSVSKEVYDAGGRPAFKGLVEIMSAEATIVTAIHNIKSNRGSETPGVDSKTMRRDYLQHSHSWVVHDIQSAFKHFEPQKIRRVYIDKPGKTEKRPLGIPTIRDRIVQECMRIVLEPIMEAQFFAHSYGFRPMRDAPKALERVQFLTHSTGYYWIVEGDISKCFDRIDHSILLKRLYHMGIKDRRVLQIIKAMLETGIMNECEVNEEGTPQGGLISPLLANVYLDMLDEWVSRQWEHKRTDRLYKRQGGKINALKKTKLIGKNWFLHIHATINLH